MKTFKEFVAETKKDPYDTPAIRKSDAEDKAKDKSKDEALAQKAKEMRKNFNKTAKDPKNKVNEEAPANNTGSGPGMGDDSTLHMKKKKKKIASLSDMIIRRGDKKRKQENDG